MINWTEILKYLLAIGVGSSVVGFLFRSLFKYIIDKDIEIYKTRLNLVSKEREISFGNIYKERANAIKIFYKRLVKTDLSFKIFLAPMKLLDPKPLSEIDKTPYTIGGKTENELGEEASNDYNNLKLFFEKNRILFDENLCSKIDVLLKELVDIWNEFELTKRYPELRKEQYEKMEKSWERLTKYIPQLKSDLENDFRKLLNHKINLNEINF